jgi:PDDEXK-like domain of unknown function (DUF3799)
MSESEKKEFELIKMEPGIYADLSNEDYHKDTAISRSGIVMFNDSPFKFWANYINPNKPEKKETEAMAFGSALHKLVLEPLDFNYEYVLEPEYRIGPKKVLLKNAGRPAFEAYKAEKAKIDYINDALEEDFQAKIIEKGLKPIDKKTFHELTVMSECLYHHAKAKDLLEDALYERSLFWLDKESGLRVKCRPDIWHDNIIVDLKTCVSANSRAYQHSMVDGGYHIQGAMIREGIRELTGKDIPNVLNICIEKTYPYEIGIKVIGEAALNEGRRKFKEILIAIKSAIQHNEWNSYQDETIELPHWYTA